MIQHFNPLRTNAKSRLLTALVFGMLTFFLLPNQYLLVTKILIFWIVFASIIILLIVLLFFNAHPRQISSMSGHQDSNRFIIFLFVLLGSTASLFGVIVLLDSIQDLPKPELINHIFIATASVISSWILVQLTFAIRYAHLFHEIQELNCKKGLNFPDGNEPDYIDFAYFSFTIGMAFQVSDVEITFRVIRRLTLLHAILSFGFNTIIIALTMNTLSALI